MAREMIVVPFNNMWSVMYENEKNILIDVLGTMITDIQHFGSTSVQGMSAKPIIDIMIVVNDINQIDEYNQVMEVHGYSVKGENGIEGRRYFVKLSQDNPDEHTHHIHIYQKGNPHISDELMFRDFLRIDYEAFKEYERVKMEASIKFRYNPSAYVDAKYDCIMKIIGKAKSYYENI